MRHLLHVVNVFRGPLNLSAVVAQPATLESMRDAQRFAAPHVQVTLATVKAANEDVLLPPGFEPLADLERDVTDVAKFTTSRPFPLLVDILERAVDAATAAGADTIIFSNIDIALQPSFYRYVDDQLDHGYDALIINRRTLPAAYHSVADLPRAWADGGVEHPGRDCFIFRTDAARRYAVGLTCLGAVGVGSALSLNLACHSQRFRWVDDANVTFHWGDERAWNHEERDEYGDHNLRETFNVFRALPHRDRLRRLGSLTERLERGELGGSSEARRKHQARRNAPPALKLARRVALRIKRHLRPPPFPQPPPMPPRCGPTHGVPGLKQLQPSDIVIAGFPGTGSDAVKLLVTALLDESGAPANDRRVIADTGATFQLAPKTIYVCRDPREALAAYFDEAAATDLASWLRSSASASPVPHSGPGLSWAQHVRAAKRFATDTPDRMLWLSLESVADAPADAVAAIAKFCGLDPSAATLRAAAEHWQPPTAATSILSQDDLDYLSMWAGPTMAELGYA